MLEMIDIDRKTNIKMVSRAVHQNSASWLPRLVVTEVVRPSATVGKPVEGDGVGVAVAVVVLHRRRLGEGHQLAGLDAFTRALARVGGRVSNVSSGALWVVAG